MLRKCALMAPVLLGCAALDAASIVTTPSCPTVTFSAAGTSIPIPVFTQAASGICSFASTPGIAYFNTGFLNISSLSLSSLGDPYVNYALAVQNVTSTTQTFTFTLTQPYLGGPYNTLTDSFSDSVTDGGPAPDGSVTIGLVGGNTFVAQPTLNGSDVSGMNTGCTVTGPPGFSGPGCVTSATLQTASVTDPAVGSFGVTLSFTLSPYDEYSFNGQVTLSNATVPEPASWIGLSLGVATILVLARRNRTRRAA